MTGDELIDVENEIWARLEAFATVTTLVSVANRRKFLGSSAPTDPFRSEAQVADLPELMLIDNGFSIDAPGTGASSSTHTWLQRYTLAVTTDDWRKDGARGISKLKMACVRAMLRSLETLPALTYVARFRPTDGQDQTADPSPEDREMRGWKAVIGVEVVLAFSRTEINA